MILHVRQQKLQIDEAGRRVWVAAEREASLDASATAVVICDMWDRHWCRGAAQRVEAMVDRMNEAVAAARAQGALIVHAPSDTMDAYAGSPARLRALAAPTVAPPQESPHADPPLPVDASDGGCDTDGNPADPGCRVWTREHPRLGLDEARDAVSDSGAEIYALMQSRGIAHLLLMGVHANMCILERSFGIKQMVRWGVDVMLCRDLTDAMYNPVLAPYVSHDAGTRLVIEHIEKFWCPSFESADLLGRSRRRQRGAGLVDVLGR